MRLVELKPFARTGVSHLAASVRPTIFAWVADGELTVKRADAEPRKLQSPGGQAISCVGISTDGLTVAAGYREGVLRVWEHARSAKPVWETGISKKPVENVAFLVTRELVVSSGKSLIVWGPGKQKPRARVAWSCRIRGLAVSRSDELAIVGTGRSLAVARVFGSEVRVVWRDRSSWSSAEHGPYFLHDDEYLLTGRSRYHTYLRSGRGSQFARSGAGGDLRGGSLTSGPDPRQFAYATVGSKSLRSRVQTLRLYTIPRPSTYPEFEIGEDVRRLVWSGNRIVCLTSEGRLRVFAVKGRSFAARSA